MPNFAAACIPPREAERLAALWQLGLLDSAPSEGFDRITRLAAKTLAIPIVLVSLLDDSRQWFKSRVGLDASETPRDVSFCGHAIYERRPFVIPDAALDERFAANPLVTGPPYVRAYLGIPLYTRDGHAIGTLCAIDRVPRSFDAVEIATLGDFAKIIEDAIHAQEVAAQTEHVLHFANESAQLFRDTFEQAAVGIVHSGLSGQLLRVNQRACDMLGYEAQELTQLSFIEITHPEDVARTSTELQRIADGEIDDFCIEKRYVRRDESTFWGSLSVALKRTPTGRPEYLISVIEDITLRKQAQSDLIRARDALQSEVHQQTQKLNESNQALRTHLKRLLDSERALRVMEHRLRSITNHVPAMIGYWNRELRCEFANEGYRDWFGVAPEAILGRTMQDLLGGTIFEAVQPHARMALQGHEQYFQRSLPKFDGRDSYLDVRYIPDIHEVQTVRGFFVLATDVTASRTVQLALEAANARLASDSATDYLTGLANRRAFTQRSEDACRNFEKTGVGYGLILLDLDNFKQINDKFGHDTGDDVLRAVGKLLRGQLRNTADIAARLGGEEFAMLCFGELDEAALCEIAERIRTQVKKETIETSRGLLQFAGTFGAALSHPGDHDWKGIYARADAALYEAKASGKDRVLFGSGYSGGGTGRFRSLRAMMGA